MDGFELRTGAGAWYWLDRGCGVRRRGVVLATVACLALVGLLASAEVAAASGWLIQRTPNPAGAIDGAFVCVSRTSKTVCTAVRFSTNRANTTMPLVERWNGTAWAIQPTPNPAGAKGSGLGGVSCASTTVCTAVGFSTNRANTTVPLVERWNGASWSIQRTRNPGGAKHSEFVGVSCASTNACTAVGFSTNRAYAPVTLAERWNGTSWTIQPTPNPGGAVSGLFDVSCASKTACTAVGRFTNRADTLVTLAERWNGASWAIQRTPNPSGKNDSGLDSVSCASTNACTAVGRFTNRARTGVTLAERWSSEIPDRLLTTGSDRRQLANTANRQTTAFAQIQACAAWARHDCFCSRARVGRAIAKATFQSPRSAAAGVGPDECNRPQARVGDRNAGRSLSSFGRPEAGERFRHYGGPAAWRSKVVGTPA